MFVVLKGIEGPYAGKRKKILLKAPEYRCLFGRTVSSNEFRLDEDPEISGLHATFLWSVQDDCLQIRDEGSFNGTALDYKELKKGKVYPVKSGSVLFAGKSKFIVTIEDSKQTPEETQENVETPKQECYCPICYKDLSRMSEVGRNQHVSGCLPEKTKKQMNGIEKIISNANDISKRRSYEDMSMQELSSLKKRMENIKLKLELELQQLQAVYYRKRSKEMLQRSSMQIPQNLNRGDSMTPEDRSIAANMLFSQDSPSKATQPATISSIQAKLTGAIPITPIKREKSTIQDNPQNSDHSDHSDNSNSSSSSNSLIENETPRKIRRVTVATMSRGIAHITPRRSSIIVSPSKAAVVQALPSSQPLHLSAQERGQRLQFYMDQIPKGLEEMPENEIQNHVKALLSQSVQELKDTQESLNDQIMTADPLRRELIDFLLVVTDDVIAELETIRPAENRRISMREEALRTPIKSPLKTPVRRETSLKEQVLEAIESDRILSNEVKAKQAVLFDRIYSSIRRSVPAINADTLITILDEQGIRYTRIE